MGYGFWKTNTVQFVVIFFIPQWRQEVASSWTRVIYCFADITKDPNQLNLNQLN